MTSAPFHEDAFARAGARSGEKTLLRVLVCGSAASGKSTLIDRLLRDTRLPPEDRHAATRRGPARPEPAGREIEGAWRVFATGQRRFAVADMPGREDDTRDMAAFARACDLAVILVDAEEGVLARTRRHAFVSSLMGIRHAVLAVNGIDLAERPQTRFEAVAAGFADWARELGLRSALPIPIAARGGGNVAQRSPLTPWYRGPTLLEHLEGVEAGEDPAPRPFRMPVRRVDSPDAGVPSFAGTIASGRVRVGDTLCAAGSGRTAGIAAILGPGGEQAHAQAGESVTLRLDAEIDAPSGDVLAPAGERPAVSDQFAARLVWLGDEPMLPGRPYLVRLAAREVAASVTEIKHRIDVDTLGRLAAKTLKAGEIGVVNLSLREPVAFDPFEENRITGGFTVVDRTTSAAVGVGRIDFALRRATNVHRQAVDVDKAARARLKGQRPAILWFTGLSGAGKSAIANIVEGKLLARGRHTYLLDGDNVRHGLNRDLGFTDADRVENIRRVAETAKLMADAGLLVLASFISPFRSERRLARELVEAGEFIEIFVDTPLAVAEARDPKGLYRRARLGEIRNFTGIDSPYEPPEAPDIRLPADGRSAEALADEVIRHLEAGGYLD